MIFDNGCCFEYSVVCFICSGGNFIGCFLLWFCHSDAVLNLSVETVRYFPGEFFIMKYFHVWINNFIGPKVKSFTIFPDSCFLAIIAVFRILSWHSIIPFVCG